MAYRTSYLWLDGQQQWPTGYRQSRGQSHAGQGVLQQANAQQQQKQWLAVMVLLVELAKMAKSSDQQTDRPDH